MGGRLGAGVKVVIINTQYVETDAMSFKSVVQSLTGKDSVVSASAVNPPPVPFLSHGMSFKDFEWMPKDLPPLDELLQALR
ncbi:hypothetical protein F511_05837 [Dorcoceras hygrometricum]|uniref:VQ domain-containing protein n=1 Tax=Dorcoceras hygrometricum TaxID=472368 RepID=A0A2Z7B6D4_9LAMI|nr:hypothetical protein F511_05837 [Dorcoceras hygrometricum]